MIVNRSSHLAAISIAGINNPMADLASRSFKKTGVHGNYDLTDPAFLTKFNSDFALPQDNSWLMLRLHDTVSSLVFSVLRGQTPPMGSWLRLRKSALDVDDRSPGITEDGIHPFQLQTLQKNLRSGLFHKSLLQKND
jgi:hypothetical protein